MSKSLREIHSLIGGRSVDFGCDREQPSRTELKVGRGWILLRHLKSSFFQCGFTAFCFRVSDGGTSSTLSSHAFRPGRRRCLEDRSFSARHLPEEISNSKSSCLGFHRNTPSSLQCRALLFHRHNLNETFVFAIKDVRFARRQLPCSCSAFFRRSSLNAGNQDPVFQQRNWAETLIPPGIQGSGMFSLFCECWTL